MLAADALEQITQTAPEEKEFRMPAPRRRVALFVTCIVDQLYPTIGLAAAKLLQAHGVEVHVPRGLTCCGQMGFNAGFRDEARTVAGRALESLRGQGDVVL